MEDRRLKWVATFCVVPLFLWAAIIGFDLYRLLYRPMVLAKPASANVVIGKNTSAASFVQMLKHRGYIHSQRLFLWLIRIQGLSQQLKAGTYQIKDQESAEQFLLRVASGDVITQIFRIIDGTTQVQVAAMLQSANDLIYRPEDWASIAGSYSSAEGLLLADTYHYDAGSDSKALLTKAHNNLMTFLETSWQHRSLDLPYKSAYEMLIAASIIEKEAALEKERRLISGVIINRLRKHMPLQMDPTVIYALGAGYQGKLTRDDLRVDSPYNTYVHRGLPPTPIAMVGKDAIDAAAHPLPTNFLYFVATGDGSHYFSENYEQQKQAVARYRGNK